MSGSENSVAPRVACFATQGSGSRDEDRIRELLAPLAPVSLGFARGRRLTGSWQLLRRIRRVDPDIVVMEGTGIAGGLILLLLRTVSKRPYIVSSGDAVAPFLAARSRVLGALGLLYESALYRGSSGFIGWSPYLVGRALTLGASRSMTAANWSSLPPDVDGAGVRQTLGIPDSAVVFGIVGSLNWSTRYGYCYGYELVRAALRLVRDDVRVLIVGDGDGRRHLENLAGDRLGHQILLPGSVPRTEVANYLAAMDVASLPQSVDGVGAFRYTTKISEYLAARVPVVTGELPLAYDLDEGWLWRLPGDAPWHDTYLDALTELMSTLQRDDVAARRPPELHLSLFDRRRQQRQVSAFVGDVLRRERMSRVPTG